MEQLNRVELRGIVGAARATKVGNRHMVRFSLATNLAYKDQEGGVVIETQWSNIVCFESDKIHVNLESISKGDKLHVIGRLRNQRYMTESGEERYSTEIYAIRIERIESEEPLQLEHL